MTTSAFVLPAGDPESRLSHLWERNLGVAVRAADDYFEMGGDSLRGTQLLTWIHQEFGIEVSLLDLFECRTLAAQTELLLSRLAGGEPASDNPITEYRFFGPAGGRLFGALHRRGSARARAGVVLCYPMGQEYMRIHRTFVELARSLARAGLAVLRFDYYGSGDSAGDTIAGSLDRWTDDIRMAIRELAAHARVQEIYLTGARIGANLALDVAHDGGIAGMVLWEPVVNGCEYLASLRRAHRDLLASNAELDGYEEHEKHGQDCFAELAGFPISRQLHDQVSAIDLLAAPTSKAILDTLVLANSDKPSLKEYVAARAHGRHRLDYVATGESDGIWLREDRQNDGLIPAQAIQEVVAWISRRV